MWPRSQSGEQLTPRSRSVISPSISCPLSARGSFRGSVFPAASAAHLLVVCSFPPNICLPSLGKRSCCGIILGPQRAWGSSLLLSPPSLSPRSSSHSQPQPRAPSWLSRWFRDELQQLQLDFHSHIPLWNGPHPFLLDPCWNSGRSFPHLGSCQSSRRCRSCGDAARGAQGCSRGLDPAASTSNSAFIWVFFFPLFCHPRGAGGRNNLGTVQRGLFEQLFAEIAALWDPGGTFSGISVGFASLSSPRVGLNQRQSLISHPPSPGACRAQQKSELDQQIPNAELSLPPLLGLLAHLSCCCGAERGKTGWSGFGV